MPVAGKATHAKRQGRTHIFYDDDEPEPFVAPRPNPRVKSTKHLLSWLPELSNAADESARDEGTTHGRRHVTGGAPRAKSILEHEEYPEAPARAGSKAGASAARSRVGVEEGEGRVGSTRRDARRKKAHPHGRGVTLTSEEVGAFTKRSPADRYAQLVATRRRSPGKVTAQDAAMMLPPLHDRPGRVASKAHEVPRWGVKEPRPAFRF